MANVYTEGNDDFEDFEETRFPAIDATEAKRLAEWFLSGVPSMDEFKGVAA